MEEGGDTETDSDSNKREASECRWSTELFKKLRGCGGGFGFRREVGRWWEGGGVEEVFKHQFNESYKLKLIKKNKQNQQKKELQQQR